MTPEVIAATIIGIGVYALFVRSNAKEQKLGKHLLENKVFLEKHKDAEIDPCHKTGDYYVAHRFGEKMIYQFYDCSYEQEKEAMNLRDSGFQVNAGKRFDSKYSDDPIPYRDNL